METNISMYPTRTAVVEKFTLANAIKVTNKKLQEELYAEIEGHGTNTWERRNSF
jgi:hypothetical protein